MALNGDQNHPHIVLFPFMAQGHIIPMLDIARLLAARGARVTVLLTPHNGDRAKPVLDRAIASGLTICVAYLRFPCVEAGLPEGCENLDMLPNVEDAVKFVDAAAMLKDQVEGLLQEIRPGCFLADVCFPWTADLAINLRIPRIVFHGTSCFALTLWFVMEDYQADVAPASDTDSFVVPNLPDRIEMTMAQLRGTPNSIPPGLAKIRREMKESTLQAVGTVFNAFEDLEPEYLKVYARLTGNRSWCIGPVSLCNEDELDKAERGHRASIDKHQCLKWLNSQKHGSVLYVCFGSSSRLGPSQLIELGMALEASNRPFIWVIRRAKNELKSWMDSNEFEKKVHGRGLVIHGWAPQVLILSHASIGCFLTHCGWNSTLEGITSGLPMITWPVHAEQFSNEKFVVNVIKTGVRVGVKVPEWHGEEEGDGGVQVRSEEIKLAIDEAMDGGDEGEARRERVRQLGEKARRAVDVGGSSYMNITRLIEDVQHGKLLDELNKLERVQS